MSAPITAGTLFLVHSSAAATDVTGYDQVWAKSDGSLWITDASGTDRQVALLSVANTFTAGQSGQPAALSLAAGKITPTKAAGNDFTYDMASGAAEVQLPTDIEAGYCFTIDVTSNATAALTWVAGYLWGDVTGSATDMTSVANDKLVSFYCRCISATKVIVMPSEVFSP